MVRFLTPPDIPSETICRVLEMPNDKLWLGIFNKALLETVYYWNWKQVNETDLTPDEATEACWAILWAYWESTNDCIEMVEAPFYDNEENVDDEENLGEQTWYDEISDWIIAGFLAISFTPAAAIAYRATIPRIRLAFKTGNAGTIVRVIFGSVDILYDTYAETPNIEFIDIDYGVITEPLDEFELRIEHTGTHNPLAVPTADGYSAEIVRGDINPMLVDVRTDPTSALKLQKTFGGDVWENFATIAPQTLVQQDEGEVCNLVQSLDGGLTYTVVGQMNLCMPDIQVLIGEGGGIIIQTSPDGGTTWVNQGVIYTDPVGDTPPPQTPQPSDPQCNAARNAMLAYYSLAWSAANLLEQDPPLEPYLAAIEIIPMLRDRMNYFIGSNVFNSIVGNVTFALAVTAGLTPFYAAAIVGGGTTGAKIRELTDYDNPLVQAAIQCELFCNADDDGIIDYGAAVEALDAIVGESIQQGAVDFITMLNAGGMSAAASARITTVTAEACEDCECPDEWCHEWNQAELEGAWDSVFGGAQGTRFVYFSIAFAATVIKDIYYEYEWNDLGNGTESARAIWEGYNFAGSLLVIDANIAPETCSWNGETSMTGITLGVNCEVASGGTITITKIIVTGEGESPFGTDNCEG